jgi:hypothetical protein
MDYAVDGLNIQRLASFDCLNRRRQLLEEAHREDPSRPCFEGAHLYMGEDDEASGAHLAPWLRQHVAAQMTKEAAIQKERRKAQEAREHGRSKQKSKGGAKGSHGT